MHSAASKSVSGAVETDFDVGGLRIDWIRREATTFFDYGMLSPDEKLSGFLFDTAATCQTDDVESPSPASTTSARSFFSETSSEWSNAEMDMDPPMVSRSRVMSGDAPPSPPKRLSADVEFLSRGSMRWRKS